MSNFDPTTLLEYKPEMVYINYTTPVLCVLLVSTDFYVLYKIRNLNYKTFHLLMLGLQVLLGIEFFIALILINCLMA